MKTKKIACLASTALVGSLLAATAALAQSTGSAEVDQVVVTAARQKQIAGQVQETLPKSRATIDGVYLQNQATGQNIFQSLNQLPGVSFTNNDPYGSSGGNLRLRGFDGNRVSVTFDGVPLNDTGNYAVYPNQMLDAELIDRASVNLGATDVDSPTASATGGTINYTTRVPSREFGGIATASIGENNYRRGFLMLESGEVGPFGTRMWAAGSYQKYDKWKGPGSLEKKQFNARIYQSLGDNGDFVSLAANYNENRNNNIRALTLAEYRAFGPNLDFTETCTNRVLNAANGTITESAPAVPGNCSDFHGRQVNPSNTGSVRGAALFHLADNLRLTVDPSFSYTLADGGSQLGTITETDGRVRGTAAAAGVDLNGNGVISGSDTVAFFTPSVTNTRRYTITSSLIWDLNSQNRFRIAYTGDYGRHRQTGEWARLNADGTPTNVFGGKEGQGEKVMTADGSFLRNRDRFSIAQLNQISAEYVGKFYDNRLVVNLGLRAPFFERELNQYCYTTNASTLPGVVTGFNVLCTTQTPNAPAADGSVTFGSSATKYIRPWSATVKYDKVLPNAGLTFQVAPGHTVYGSYAEGFSSPRTDNLYTATIVNGVGTPADTQPETTKTFDLGYRYSAGSVLGTVALWNTKYQNRIVQSFDPDLGISIDRNVGDVDAYGLDSQVAWQVAEYLTVTASYSYNKSEIQSDLINGAAAGNVLPLKGKQIVETPEHTFGGRLDWDITETLHFGVQGKFTGDRFSTDVNDEVAPHYSVWDLDIRYDLPFAKRTYAQLNVTNLFDEEYFGSISSRTNALPIAGVTGTGAPTYYIGAPRTVQFTLRTEF